jgi:hypothetical protein
MRCNAKLKGVAVMRTISSIVFAFCLAAVTCLAQGAAPANCGLEGAWYGGAPDAGFPYYQAFIASQGGDRYSAIFEYGAAVTPPYLNWTQWKGDLVKKHGKSYAALIFQMLQFDPLSPLLPPGVDPNLPEIDFIHVDHMEFIDCNTISITYDKWYVYYNFTNDIKPLQEPPWPGYIWIIDPPIVEVYHRIPAAGSASFSMNMTSIGPATQVKAGPLLPRVRPR